MIERAHTTARHSQSVAYSGLIFLAGITAKNRSADAKGQTEEIFQIIERLLAEKGASKESMLSAQIWLKDIDSDFQTFTNLWEQWIPMGTAPARAVVESKMAAPDILVEVMVIAAPQ
ncbi:UNVERIFIED_ORG: enamine deaminase RidA (YjgF/YER057c/UK114 family) [Herbaspirillum seropedicae]